MAKHFIIYYPKGTGTYVVTEPRPWARNNPNYFPNCDFVNTHPTTSEIESFLIQYFDFHYVNTNNPDVVLIQNLDANLKI
jgi:hypothetical protein